MFKIHFFAFILIGFLSFTHVKAQEIWMHDPLDNMPILEKTPDIANFVGASPIEQRGPEFRKFLAASLKINVSGASGSGTIIYYDTTKNLAYVATCGHLWSPGVMNVEEGKSKNLKCKVTTWYHNEKKLDQTKTYDAKVIFYSYIRGADTALITFNPDWKPDYFPIAPANYVYKQGNHAHSLGCDGGSEVAHYDIQMIGIQGNDLVTQFNSPRPGRSGGGLMDDQGYYIGTCWGTQYRDGSGLGFFTPLSIIHEFWSRQNGYQFLLNVSPSFFAKQLPIVDKTGQNKQYSPEYILIPNLR